VSTELETPEQSRASPRARPALLLDFGSRYWRPLQADDFVALARSALPGASEAS
jgi:hypothetical protein